MKDLKSTIKEFMENEKPLEEEIMQLVKSGVDLDQIGDLMNEIISESNKELEGMRELKEKLPNLMADIKRDGYSVVEDELEALFLKNPNYVVLEKLWVESKNKLNKNHELVPTLKKVIKAHPEGLLPLSAIILSEESIKNDDIETAQKALQSGQKNIESNTKPEVISKLYYLKTCLELKTGNWGAAEESIKKVSADIHAASVNMIRNGMSAYIDFILDDEHESLTLQKTDEK